MGEWVDGDAHRHMKECMSWGLEEVQVRGVPITEGGKEEGAMWAPAAYASEFSVLPELACSSDPDTVVQDLIKDL